MAAERTQPVRRRTRLARGPLTIGEAAAPVQPILASPEPYRPDTIADGGRAFGLTVRAASVRGLAKRFTGGPRQDDVCLRRHEPSGTLIAAVADGVSAAARSDLGAALAVRYATAAVVRQLDAQDGELRWGDAFEQAAWALVEEHRRAAGDPAAGVEEAAATLATTLLVAAIQPGEESVSVRLAAVGDSPAFVLRSGAFEEVAAEAEREDGLIGGGVDALLRATARVRSGECRLQDRDVLLLCTDGLSLPLAGGAGEVGRTLARELRDPPDVIDFARLLDFSRSTYDDDRSLVAVWWGR
jgi:serine/threonine protein phosphatase PrpC